MELFKSIFKITLISLIAYITIQGRFDEVPPLVGKSVGQILIFMGEVMLEIMIKVLVAMIFSGFSRLHISTVHLSEKPAHDQARSQG